MQGSSRVVARELHFEASLAEWPNYGPKMMSIRQLDVWKSERIESDPVFWCRSLSCFNTQNPWHHPVLLLGCLQQLVTCFSSPIHKMSTRRFWVHFNNLQTKNKPILGWSPLLSPSCFGFCGFCSRLSCSVRRDRAALGHSDLQSNLHLQELPEVWVSLGPSPNDSCKPLSPLGECGGIADILMLGWGWSAWRSSYTRTMLASEGPARGESSDGHLPWNIQYLGGVSSTPRLITRGELCVRKKKVFKNQSAQSTHFWVFPVPGWGGGQKLPKMRDPNWYQCDHFPEESGGFRVSLENPFEA